jgi:hypothetical protein
MDRVRGELLVGRSVHGKYQLSTTHIGGTTIQQIMAMITLFFIRLLTHTFLSIIAQGLAAAAWFAH